MGAAQITVIVPAYNESMVIGATLAPLAQAAADGYFEVIVVPNNCSDETADQARRACPAAQVIETRSPGKPNAINLGVQAARGDALVFLDADLAISVTAIEQLCAPILSGCSDASCGRMLANLDGARLLVRRFYAGWALSPYHDKGKFGGVFALSAALAGRIFPIPDVIADDEYISRMSPTERTAFVPEAQFTVFAPRRMSDLIKIRRRSRRGILQLEEMGLKTSERKTGGSSLRMVLGRALTKPSIWAGVAVYAATIVFVRLTVRSSKLAPGKAQWERDDSSREGRGSLSGSES